DLNSARKLERRIRRLDRLARIGTLSAGVAHEIKNALVAIKSFSDLLAERNQDVEMTSLISRQTKRIDSLVTQLLKFAGPAKPTFSSVSIHEVIENSLRLVQHHLTTRKIHLVRALDAGIESADQMNFSGREVVLHEPKGVLDHFMDTDAGESGLGRSGEL